MLAPMNAWKKHDYFKAVLVTVFMVALLSLFLPFYAEILLAAVFAFAIEPALGRLLQARHLRWKTSVATILGAMFLFVAAPISLVAYKAYVYFLEISQIGVQNTDWFKKLIVFRTQVLALTNQALHGMHLENQIDLAGVSEDGLSRVGNFTVQMSTRLIYHIPEVLLSVFVFCVALYFFLAEARLVKNVFMRMQVLSTIEAEKLIRVFQKSSFNTVVTSLSLGALAASVVSLGALVFGGGDFSVVFVVTFFCSFVPVIGAGPVALVIALYKLVMGSYGAAFGFLIVAVIVGIVDNGVRPYLISSNDGDLHPVVSLLALIGGLVIFGMPGVFLGPVVASAAMQIVPIFYPRANVPATPTTP